MDINESAYSAACTAWRRVWNRSHTERNAHDAAYDAAFDIFEKAGEDDPADAARVVAAFANDTCKRV